MLDGDTRIVVTVLLALTAIVLAGYRLGKISDDRKSEKDKKGER